PALDQEQRRGEYSHTQQGNSLWKREPHGNSLEFISLLWSSSGLQPAVNDFSQINPASAAGLSPMLQRELFPHPLQPAEITFQINAPLGVGPTRQFLLIWSPVSLMV
ncbi:MAG TPA: hypothetical protein VGH14_04635, partial [Solirubrobacterales bacterium]